MIELFLCVSLSYIQCAYVDLPSECNVLSNCDEKIQITDEHIFDDNFDIFITKSPPKPIKVGGNSLIFKSISISTKVELDIIEKPLHLLLENISVSFLQEGLRFKTVSLNWSSVHGDFQIDSLISDSFSLLPYNNKDLPLEKVTFNSLQNTTNLTVFCPKIDKITFDCFPYNSNIIMNLDKITFSCGKGYITIITHAYSTFCLTSTLANLYSSLHFFTISRYTINLKARDSDLVFFGVWKNMHCKISGGSNVSIIMKCEKGPIISSDSNYTVHLNDINYTMIGIDQSTNNVQTFINSKQKATVYLYKVTKYGKIFGITNDIYVKPPVDILKGTKNINFKNCTMIFPQTTFEDYEISDECKIFAEKCELRNCVWPSYIYANKLNVSYLCGHAIIDSNGQKTCHYNIGVNVTILASFSFKGYPNAKESITVNNKTYEISISRLKGGDSSRFCFSSYEGNCGYDRYIQLNSTDDGKYFMKQYSNLAYIYVTNCLNYNVHIYNSVPCSVIINKGYFFLENINMIKNLTVLNFAELYTYTGKNYLACDLLDTKSLYYIRNLNTTYVMTFILYDWNDIINFLGRNIKVNTDNNVKVFKNTTGIFIESGSFSHVFTEEQIKKITIRIVGKKTITVSVLTDVSPKFEFINSKVTYKTNQLQTDLPISLDSSQFNYISEGNILNAVSFKSAFNSVFNSTLRFLDLDTPMVLDYSLSYSDISINSLVSSKIVKNEGAYLHIHNNAVIDPSLHYAQLRVSQSIDVSGSDTVIELAANSFNQEERMLINMHFSLSEPNIFLVHATRNHTAPKIVIKSVEEHDFIKGLPYTEYIPVLCTAFNNTDQYVLDNQVKNFDMISRKYIITPRSSDPATYECIEIAMTPYNDDEVDEVNSNNSGWLYLSIVSLGIALLAIMAFALIWCFGLRKSAKSKEQISELSTLN